MREGRGERKGRNWGRGERGEEGKGKRREGIFIISHSPIQGTHDENSGEKRKIEQSRGEKGKVMR